MQYKWSAIEYGSAQLQQQADVSREDGDLFQSEEDSDKSESEIDRDRLSFMMNEEDEDDQKEIILNESQTDTPSLVFRDMCFIRISVINSTRKRSDLRKFASSVSHLCRWQFDTNDRLVLFNGDNHIMNSYSFIS
eukprot:42365_1